MTAVVETAQLQTRPDVASAEFSKQAHDLEAEPSPTSTAPSVATGRHHPDGRCPAQRPGDRRWGDP